MAKAEKQRAQTQEIPRVALVGFGYWGRNLARNLDDLGVLRAIVDTSLQHRDEAKELFPNVQICTAVGEVFDDAAIVGVVLATPAITHATVTRQALEAGKDVFVEKPLALTLSDGKELVALAEERNAILMVGHLLEYHPAVEEIERRVIAGEMGALQYIYSNRLNWGRLRREESILWSFAPHDIAVILRLIGTEPLRVLATGGGMDST